MSTKPDTKLNTINYGKTADALSVAWAQTYGGLRKPGSENKKSIEDEIAKAIALTQPHYDVWITALQTFLPGTGLEIGHTHTGGSIYVATELVIRGHVPLEELLAVAAICFAGCEKRNIVTYL